MPAKCTFRQLFGVRIVSMAIASISIGHFANAHTPHHAIDAQAVSPDYENDQTIYILVQNKLRRSADRGNTWKQLVNGLDGPFLLSDISISPHFSTDSTVFVSTNGDGVFASDDRGWSFQPFNSGLEELRIGMLLVVPTAAETRVIAAGASRGLFASSATEATWRRIMSDDVQITALSYINSESENYALAGDSNGGVWKSNAQLGNWRRMTKLSNSGAVTALVIRQEPGASASVFIGTSQRGLLRTKDFGETYEDFSQEWPLSELECSASLSDERVPDFRVRDVSVAADGRLYVTTWDAGVLASDDGGSTWRTMADGVSCDDQAGEPSFNVPQFRELDIVAGDDWFLAGFDGLFRFDRLSATWTRLDAMPVSLIRGLAAGVSSDGRQSLAVGTYGGGAYISRDNGLSWSIANHGLRTTRLADLDFLPNGDLLALAKERLLRSESGDQSWRATDLTYRGWRRRIGAGLERRLGVSPKFGTGLFLSDTERGSPWPMEIELSPNYESDTTLFVGFRSHGVWKSGNAGRDWERNWEGPTDYVTSLQVSPDFEKDATVFAGVRGNGIYRSIDAGNTWHSVNEGFGFLGDIRGTAVSSNFVADPPLSRAIKDVLLAVSPDFASDRTVLAGSSSGLFESKDGGQSWRHVTVTELNQDAPVRAIAFSPEYRLDRTTFVSLKGRGLFLSANGNQSFRPIAPELSRANHDIEFLEASTEFGRNGTLFAASEESILVSRDRGATWQQSELPVRYEDWRGAGTGPIQFSGDWSRETAGEYSASTQTILNEPAAAATLRFVGSNVSWRGERCPACGNATVVVDGVQVAEVDLSSDTVSRGEVWSIEGLGSTSHEIQIINGGGQRVSVDAIDVHVR